ncbi:hypothetical protein SAMN04488133_1972 [Halobellus limi]|uniref:Uncharacterized protein n=2 Tax=Halobellus limi TaxID=699433 RepID=A0A1H5ZFP3_9EURY|nr:hypothetical protein SAMN04488133_1972 [Halobellus limi]
MHFTNIGDILSMQLDYIGVGLLGMALGIIGKTILKRLSNDLYDAISDVFSEKRLSDEELLYRTREIQRDIRHLIQDFEPESVDLDVALMLDDRSKQENYKEHIRQTEEEEKQRKALSNEYKRDFGSDVELIISEYKIRGYDVETLERYHRNPVNPISMRLVTNELDQLKASLERDTDPSTSP